MTTIKPKQEPEISIPSNDPRSDVWNFISDFESEYFVRGFIEKKIRRKTHYRNASILKKLKKNDNKVITYDPIRLQDVKAIVSEITINAKQSRDIYEKSKELPLLSKPILLHYVFEKLANILVLHTFRDVKISYSHGLTYYGRKNVPINTPIGDEPITIMKKGLFQCLHDCYSLDPSVYYNTQMEEAQFYLNDVINAGKINYLELEYAVNHGGTSSYNLVDRNPVNQSQSQNTKTDNKIMVKELNREFIFIFAISALARYRVKEWDSIIAGKDTDLVIKIRQYLQSVEILFPNLILNELYGTIVSFFSPARMGEL